MISVLAPGAPKAADFASAPIELVLRVQESFSLSIKNGVEMGIETFDFRGQTGFLINGDIWKLSGHF